MVFLLATTKFHYPNARSYVSSHYDLSLVLAWKKVRRGKIDVAASSFRLSTSKGVVVVQKKLKPILLSPSSSLKVWRRFLRDTRLENFYVERWLPSWQRASCAGTLVESTVSIPIFVSLWNPNAFLLLPARCESVILGQYLISHFLFFCL